MHSSKASSLPLIPSHISCTEIKSHPSNSPILEGGKLRQCGEGVAQGFHTRVLPTGGNGTDAAGIQAYALILVGQTELSRVTFLSEL